MKLALLIAIAAASLLASGCDVPQVPGCEIAGTTTQRVPLSKVRPPAEVAANARHKNIGNARQGWGSCYHAAACDGLAALGRPDLAQRWYSEHRGGASCYEVCAIAKGYGIPCKCTAKYDPAILQAASDARLGAAISFPDLDPYGRPIGSGMHAVWFAGYVGDYACVLDNNYPGSYSWFSRESFLSWWRGYGSQAVVFLLDPPPEHPVMANRFVSR